MKRLPEQGVSRNLEGSLSKGHSDQKQSLMFCVEPIFQGH